MYQLRFSFSLLFVYYLVYSQFAEAFRGGQYRSGLISSDPTTRRLLTSKHISITNFSGVSSSTIRGHGGKRYHLHNVAPLYALTPELTFIPSLTAPDPLVATVVNGIGYLLLKVSSQKSLTPAGLVNSAILGLGLWTFLGEN